METVTISLETYEEMKSRIRSLEIQVQEKTIVKYNMHPIAAVGVLILCMGAFIAIMHNMA